MSYNIRHIDSCDEDERKRVISFLEESFGLGFDKDTEHTLVMERGEMIVATASFSGNVVKQVAVSDEIRGEGYMVKLLDELIREMVLRGHLHIFVFTKPGNIEIFTGMGFRKVGGIYAEAVLLEWGAGGVGKYKSKLAESRKSGAENVSAIVMNCNPFTKGHRYLIECASHESEAVYVFVLEADKSIFSFTDRISMVRDGVKDLSNVMVMPSGPYIISPATFPSYFTHEKDLLRVQTELDAEIFAVHIAPALSIGKRWVGREPHCQVTETYNKALGNILGMYNIELSVLERLQIGGKIVSASGVREALRTGDMETARSMVPQTTWNYVSSERGKAVIEKIRRIPSRH